MLTRNLLYTAITRAKKKCLIVGDALALKRAIKNTREVERYSKLLSRIREAKEIGTFRRIGEDEPTVEVFREKEPEEKIEEELVE